MEFINQLTDKFLRIYFLKVVEGISKETNGEVPETADGETLEATVGKNLNKLPEKILKKFLEGIAEEIREKKKIPRSHEEKFEKILKNSFISEALLNKLPKGFLKKMPEKFDTNAQFLRKLLTDELLEKFVKIVENFFNKLHVKFY